MSVKDLSDPQILEHLKSNTIFRNDQLSVLIRLLNSLQESTTLAVDGAWGSGKTVFIKQLTMLADPNVDDYGRNTLDEGAINQLRSSQKVFYFNAWEQDYIGDALGALLLGLIVEGNESLQLASIKKAVSMVNISAGIKNLTHDFIDLDANTSRDKLVENIKERVDRHSAVNEFIDSLKGDAERLIFIVDELDRCMPSFAVDLLESIKHYFSRDDVTFVVTANITQLSYTIKKYYGSEFDGHSYLNRFFDFTIGLKRVDIEGYASKVLKWMPNSYVVHEVAHDAIRHYNFSMREINAYHSSLLVIKRFLGRDGNWREEQYPIQLIFVPLALALKINSGTDYTTFVSGMGEELLRDFLPHTDSGMTYACRWVKDREGLDESQVRSEAIDIMVEHYKILFTPEGRRGAREDLQDFDDAISLISAYTTIAERGEK